MSFPISPSDNQLYTTPYGAVYQYTLAENKWVKYTMHLGVTGMDGVTGIQGVQGLTGHQGHTGLANFLDESAYPTVVPAELLWNRTDEALYAGMTGYGGHWIQISAGSIAGSTGMTGPTGAFGGPQGATGLANFLDESDYPTVVPAELLWNRSDEALYAGMTGYGGHWIQISAGAKGGATGSQGVQGVPGVTGISGGSLIPSGTWSTQFTGFTGLYEPRAYYTVSGDNPTTVQRICTCYVNLIGWISETAAEWPNPTMKLPVPSSNLLNGINNVDAPMFYPVTLRFLDTATAGDAGFAVTLTGSTVIFYRLTTGTAISGKRVSLSFVISYFT